MTFYKKLLSTFAIVKAPAFLDSGRPLPSGCAFLPPAAGTSSWSARLRGSWARL